MKRLIPLFAAVAALCTTAVVVAFAVGASGDGHSKSTERQSAGGGSPAVSAACAKDHPNCNDMVIGQGGGGTACALIAPDAPAAPPVDIACPTPNPSEPDNANGPVCSKPSDASVTASCEPPGPTGGGPTALPSARPPSGVSTAYDVTVPFEASVTDSDL